MGGRWGKSSAPARGAASVAFLLSHPLVWVRLRPGLLSALLPKGFFQDSLDPDPGCANSGVFSSDRMIYKCAMCDTVFTHKPLLSSHFDQHLLNQRVSVFKCPDCPLLFAQKRTMLEHLKVMLWPGSALLARPLGINI